MDVGNFRIEWGVIERGEIRGTGRIAQERIRDTGLQAACHGLDRAFRALQSTAYDPRLVLTGGDASRILNALCETPLHRPHLVLQGLATMLDNPQ